MMLRRDVLDGIAFMPVTSQTLSQRNTPLSPARDQDDAQRGLGVEDFAPLYELRPRLRNMALDEAADTPVQRRDV